MSAFVEPKSKELEIDFGHELPSWDFFPIIWLAERWHCSSMHIFRLIESGELPVPIDLRNKGSSRATIRIPRKALIEFLNRRANIAAIAAKNPQPKARKFLDGENATNRREVIKSTRKS
jgi:hypothetical protein